MKRSRDGIVSKNLRDPFFSRVLSENNNLSSPSRYFDKHHCCSRRRSLNDVQRQTEARKMLEERLFAVKITRLRGQRCCFSMFVGKLESGLDLFGLDQAVAPIISSLLFRSSLPRFFHVLSRFVRLA